VLLTGWKKIPADQKSCRDLGGDATSVWSFCARWSDVVLRGLGWRSSETLAVFSGYSRHGLHTTLKTPSYLGPYFSLVETLSGMTQPKGYAHIFHTGLCSHTSWAWLHVCFLPQKWFQDVAEKIRSGFSHSSFGGLCHPNRRSLSFFLVRAQRAPRYTLLSRFSMGCCHKGLQVGFLPAVVRFKRE